LEIEETTSESDEASDTSDERALPVAVAASDVTTLREDTAVERLSWVACAATNADVTVSTPPAAFPAAEAPSARTDPMSARVVVARRERIVRVLGKCILMPVGVTV
jgi:hypothetical protein